MQPYSFLAAGHSQNFRKILNCACFIIFTKNHFSHFGSLLLIHGVSCQGFRTRGPVGAAPCHAGTPCGCRGLSGTALQMSTSRRPRTATITTKAQGQTHARVSTEEQRKAAQRERAVSKQLGLVLCLEVPTETHSKRAIVLSSAQSLEL